MEKHRGCVAGNQSPRGFLDGCAKFIWKLSREPNVPVQVSTAMQRSCGSGPGNLGCCRRPGQKKIHAPFFSGQQLVQLLQPHLAKWRPNGSRCSSNTTSGTSRTWHRYDVLTPDHLTMNRSDLPKWYQSTLHNPGILLNGQRWL